MRHISSISLVLWIAPLMAEGVLLWVLIRRKAQREYPWFFALLAFKILSETVTLPLAYRTTIGYFYAYWIGEGLQRVLQVLAIYELFGKLLFGVRALTRPAKLL